MNQAPAGYNFRYFGAAELVEMAYRGQTILAEGHRIYAPGDAVTIDEVGFAPLDDAGGPTVVPLRGRRL